MRVWAEIPERAAADLAGGRQRRRDLDAYARVLERLGGTVSVHLTGGAERLSAAIGLATAAVVDGRRAVLLEADLARPRLAAVLGLRPVPGLAEFLAGECEEAAVLQTLVLAGPGAAGASEPLVCVAAGAPLPDPASALASARFLAALEGLRDAYDLVVLAGPPLEDEGPLAALTAGSGRTLAVCAKRSLPRRLRRRVDGLLVPQPTPA